MLIRPVTLEGPRVRLAPLTPAHHAGLCEVGLEPSIWQWYPFPVKTADQMREFIETAVRAEQAGTALPFATIDVASGRVAGSTRFMNIDTFNRRVEIGTTWLGLDFQRSWVNTEAKYLMMRHAFESWNCVRVELKTDSLNARSRAAILRLGARDEGTLRNHMVTHSGRLRHTVYYSVIDAEWPGVKRGLEEKMAGGLAAALRTVEQLNESQRADLRRMYEAEWWSGDRQRASVEQLIAQSDLVVGLAGAADARLLAFARVVTDFADKALILDFTVENSVRGRGLGRALMDTVLRHPRLARVRHFEMYCRPALCGYFQQWGFQEVEGDIAFVRKTVGEEQGVHA